MQNICVGEPELLKRDTLVQLLDIIICNIISNIYYVEVEHMISRLEANQIGQGNLSSTVHVFPAWNGYSLKKLLLVHNNNDHHMPMMSGTLSGLIRLKADQGRVQLPLERSAITFFSRRVYSLSGPSLLLLDSQASLPLFWILNSPPLLLPDSTLF